MKVLRSSFLVFVFFPFVFLSATKAENLRNDSHQINISLTERGEHKIAEIFSSLDRYGIILFYKSLPLFIALHFASLGMGIIKRKNLKLFIIDYILCILVLGIIISGTYKKVFDPTQGTISKGLLDFINQLKIGTVQPQGKYPREWWDSWLYESGGTGRSKLSIEYSQAKSQVIGKNFNHSYEDLESQIRENIRKIIPYDYPPEKIKHLLLTLIILTGKGIFHFLFFVSTLFSQLSLFLYFLFSVVLNFIEECLFHLSLLLFCCFALLLPYKPSLRLLGKSFHFLLGANIPMLSWSILSYLCFIFLTTLYGAIFEDRSIYFNLFHSSSHDIHRALSKTYLLFSFLDFLPAPFRLVFLGFWQLSWEAGFYGLMTFSITILLLIGIFVPFWGMLRSIQKIKNAPIVAIRSFKKIRIILGLTLNKIQESRRSFLKTEKKEDMTYFIEKTEGKK
ncbi:hypothetical protein IT6_00875 [Methylacidiphilum caldifontis]|uniref:hypothetical protein n=1 Tax=Methylacidiphilum caldifontis TaxID=2795386 RepID=UPI001A8BFC60|nr:hypothetical protein [Methylacidiphilum caldifontis]QSR88894.1 hypothetical protein IT6_00875 [Methylacidiphilum caldifontis]